jgi:hypothetical protein
MKILSFLRSRNGPPAASPPLPRPNPQAPGPPALHVVPAPHAAPASPPERDADGQPLNRNYNKLRRAERSVDEFLGFLKGLLADDTITPEKVAQLAKWALRNEEAVSIWPVSEVARRLNEIATRGTISQHDCAGLHELFRLITGPDSDEILEANSATRLPLTWPEPFIRFSGRTFVFTGMFLYGVRKECWKAVDERGGIHAETVTNHTDYLVIGILGSRDWIHTTHGRKIEQAMEVRSRNLPICIVSEEHWMQSINVQVGRSDASGRTP